MNSQVFELFGGEFTVAILLIPIINGVIGYCTNWVGIKMMFVPTKFVGWRIPITLFGVPLIGWQGMIPNRVVKLPSLSVDQALEVLGRLSDVIKEMEPEVLGAYVVEAQRDEIRRLTEEILAEEYPILWASMPTSAREALHRRIESELPRVMSKTVDRVGDRVDRLLDVKLMVVRALEADPGIFNLLIKRLAYKELGFVVRSGLYLGIPLGVIPMSIFVFVTDHWAAVPIGAAVVGYLTNFIALKLIFYPAEPTRVGPVKLHGLMLRRKDELAVAYAQVFAHDILTAPRIVDRMLHGPAGDRTRQLLLDSIQEVIERNVGPAKSLVMAVAGRRLEALEAQVADSALAMVPTFLEENAEFIEDRQEQVAQMIGSRMGAMSYPEFQKLMRAPFEQDEWLAIAIGAVIGFGAGLLQVAITL